MSCLLEISAEESFGEAISSLFSWLLNTGIKVLISIIILAISFRIVTVIARKIEKNGNKDNYDKTVMRTLAYVFNVGAKIVIAVCLVGYIGIDTGGITALIASLGVGIGLAVNGALSNLAGGVLILLTRPFRIDDFIEAQGESGTVEDIHMICTKLRTPDNKVVYLPNGALANGNITNYSEKKTRRVDFDFLISYEDDFGKARDAVTEILTSHSLSLKEPEPVVRVAEYGESGVRITARVWVKSEDYWTVHFDLMENIKKSLNNNGITIPYNQLEIRIKDDKCKQ